MTKNISLLCTGDLHLGRHPTRIPSELDGPAFSPSTVWQSTAQEAIDRDVDAVVVTGDVVDRENRYFEAYGAFEEGAILLDDADIPLVAVSGNHDFDVLPQLLENLDLDSIHLLGADGSWERWTLELDETVVHFDGWSFPDEHVLNSPLDEYDLQPPTDEPVVGILHADLDVQGSEYAPVRSNELRGTFPDAWLLGHIHSPGVRVDVDPFVLYPGSPQPLDPGEPGAHGPWLLTLDETESVEATQLPLATVRFDEFEVDVGGADDPKSVPPSVTDDVRDMVRTNVDTGTLELLLTRIKLTGRTSAHADLVDQQRSIQEQLAFKDGSLPVRVESLEVETRPEVDLEELARGDSPAAFLADVLLMIEKGELRDERPQLVEDTLEAMQQAHGAGAYTLLRREDTVERPDEDAALERLERQARLLLDTLLDQKRGNG